MNINKEIKIKIVPGKTKTPNTARNSSIIKTKIFFKAVEYWELTNQQDWGNITKIIKVDTQLRGKSIKIIKEFGSNDENRLPIYKYSPKDLTLITNLSFFTGIYVLKKCNLTNLMYKMLLKNTKRTNQFIGLI